MRVAVVAPSMRILGGQAVQAERLLNAWRDDPDVTAWLVPINPMPPRGLRWAIRVKYLRTVVTQLAYWPLLLRELARADIVHVFSASYLSFLLAPLPAVLVAMLLRRPVVLNYRSGEAPDHLRRSAVARVTLARVDRNVVPSTFLQRVFGTFDLPAHVVPNIVDLDRFRFRARHRVAPKLVSTRNFEGLYNVACTLRAFRLVQDQYPEASLTLVGAGHCEPSLRALARDLSLRHVTFVGRVQPADIWRHYADADIYVQTPDIDNMPSSILEAFSSGLPVVSTDAGGVPAIVTDEVTGLLAPVNDHLAIARQVLRLIRAPGLAARLSDAGREQCEQYTWSRVRSRWITVYRAVARAGARAVPDVVLTGRTAPGSARSHAGATRRVASPSQAEGPAPRGDGTHNRSDARGASGRKHPVLARLRAMDSSELRFRARTCTTGAVRRIAGLTGSRWNRSTLAARLAAVDPLMRSAIDHLRTGNWMAANRELTRHFQGRSSRFVLDPRFRRILVEAVASRFPRAAEDAEQRAKRILSERYDLLGYRGLEFTGQMKLRPCETGEAASWRRRRSARPADGLAIDWKFDPVSHRRAADSWWSAVRYLDPANGDHKVIWELNRHQHWLALGRAYWLTGRDECRTRFVGELESWLAQNPPLVGINWASMLELALRGLSWLWALHLFLDDPLDGSAEASDAPWVVDLLLGLDRQMRHVEENLSLYFSPNTHLTGEALALYAVGRALPELACASRWEALGRRLLIDQAAVQVMADGGHAERSAHYHRYTLDFYLLALAIARRTGDGEAERAFEPVVARLARFAWALADPTGYLPRIGDDDGGSLFPLCGGETSDVRPSLSVAASLLPSEVLAEEFVEEAIWIAGVEALPAAGHSPGSRRSLSHKRERSTAFPATGYFVSRSRSGDHLVFDAGPHGFLNGGHAHADALALTLTLRRHRFLIDAGTGTYTMDAALRDRLRSTALHNTVELDGRSQSQPDGPFHWLSAADGRAIAPALNPRFDFFEGAHEGYAPATHRRAVFADVDGDLWLVADHVLDTASHAASVHWHLDPEWDVRIDAPVIGAAHDDGLAAVLATTARRLDVFRGDAVSGLGWCSPTYGHLVSCATIRFSKSGTAPFSIATLILPAHDRGHVSVEQIPATGGATGTDSAALRGGYAFAVRIARPGAIDLALFAVPDRTSDAGGSKPRRTWRFGDFETDARFVYVRLSRDGTVRGVSLVDGSLLQRITDDPLRLEVAQAVRDLSIGVDPTGSLDLFGSRPLPTVALDVPAYLINRVRVNEAPVSFRRSGSAVVVPPVAGAVTARTTESPVGTR